MTAATCEDLTLLLRQQQEIFALAIPQILAKRLQSHMHMGSIKTEEYSSPDNIYNSYFSSYIEELLFQPAENRLSIDGPRHIN